LKALSKSGCCNENLWKYDVRRYRTNPPQKCYDDAVRYKNVSYYRISSLYDVISALAEGNPVIFGATLFSSFYDADENGIVPVPKKTDYEIGRHCMLISGHFENSNQFIVRNSWGSGWAGIMKGYCLMPYEYIGDKSLVSDLWVLNFRG
jgi:C1A family cysteine protease